MYTPNVGTCSLISLYFEGQVPLNLRWYRTRLSVVIPSEVDTVIYTGFVTVADPESQKRWDGAHDDKEGHAKRGGGVQEPTIWKYM